jgi:hypothetical protein
MREVDPLTNQAYRFAEKLEAEKPRMGHQHDAPWHVSFHGSAFPGDDPKACGRRAIYTMLDIPRGGFSRRSRQFMDAGKDLEVQLTRRWHAAGMLLSAPPDSAHQTQFEDPSVWLTSTVDALIVRPRSDRPFVGEVKNTSAEVMDAMKRLLRGPHEEYVRQVKCEIGLAHEHGPWNVIRCVNSGRLAVQVGKRNGKIPWVCPEHGGDKCLEEFTLRPVEHGYLYYVSRDDPQETREFYFENDPAFMDAGRKQLAVWRKFFEEGVLPATQVTGKHPFGWNWTTDDSPCKWCPFGPTGSYVCKEDHAESVKRGKLLPLADSLAVEEAQEIRPEYDLGKVRAAVFARWAGSQQS